MDTYSTPKTNRRFWLLVVGIICLSICSAAYWYYYNEKKEIHAVESKELSSIALVKVEQIAHWRNDRISDAKFHAQSPLFNEAVERFIKQPTHSTVRAQLLSRLMLTKNEHTYERICLFSANGTLLLSTDSTKKKASSTTIQQVQAVAKEKNIFFHDFQYDSADNKVYMDIYVPIGLRRPLPIAVLVLRVNPENELFPLISWWPLPTSTNETFIVYREADSVVFLSSQHFLSDRKTFYRRSIADTVIPAIRGVLGFEGETEGIDYRGKQVLASVHKIPNAPWYLIAKVDTDEVFQELYFRRTIIIIVAFLLIIASTGTLGVLLYYHQRNLYRKQLATESTLRKTYEEFRTTLYSIGDGVIITDAAGNIRNMNSVAEKLSGWKEQVAVGKHIQEVLVLKNEETGMPAHNPIQRVIREGVIVGLANHTVLVAKDGTERPIADSAAPIFDTKTKSISGVVLVFRDQTEERQKQKALRDSESLLRESQRQARIGSYELDISSGVWTSSETLDEIFGIPPSYSKTVEGWSALIHPDDREMMVRYFQNEVVAARGKFNREYRIIRQSDNQVRWVHGLGGLVLDDNGAPVKMLGTIQDITERKLQELKVEDSERSYRALFNSIQDALYIQDNQGRFLDVNDGAVAMYGYPREFFIGKTPEVLSAPGKNDMDSIAKKIREAFEGKPQRFEFWGKRATGEIFPKEVRLFKSVYFGQDVIIAVAQDITKRKHAEEILRASEERYRKLIDASPDAIAITDVNGNLLFLSERTIELFGGSHHKSYEGENILNWITPQHREKALKGIHDVVAGVPNADNQYKLLREDGSMFYGEINAAPLIDANGNPEGIVALIRDITQRKQAEESLRKFSLVIEQSPAVVVITDKNGDIEYVNKKFTELTGYTLEEVQGKNPRILKSGLTPEATYKEMWSRLHEGKEWKGIFCNKKKNGELYWEEALITPLYDDEGTLVNYVALKEDITLQRKIAEEKAALEEQLRHAQKMESIGTLASGIAHDFNNILGIVMAHVSLLERLKDDQEKFSASVDTVFRTINRGASLVKQILTFARKTGTNLEFINVNKTIAEIQKMLGETFPKSITITTQLEKGLPLLSVDSTQFNQSVLNLCTNARDAMKDEGNITIRTQVVNGNTIAGKFPAAAGRQFVAIAVSDTGPGIDELLKEKIFEPFFTTKDKGKGTGLGLSVVFGVMQNHNGFVDVESEPGKGATFTLYFPLPEGMIEQGETVDRSEKDVKGGTETILFVEDEEALTHIALQMLKSKGYIVITANNGEEGYKLFSKYQDSIDLIISDVGMPIMSGEKMYELIKRIKPSIRIIFATGYIEPSVKESLIQKGAKEFIQKPYNFTEFLQKVREVLDKEAV